MSTYKKQLGIFQGGVMSLDKAAAIKLIKSVRHNEFPEHVRLGVYANAYKVRLVEATEVDYFALKNHIGEDAFDTLMGDFVDDNPSSHWDLNHYPISFADYIKTKSDDRFAQDITLLEATITEVFWMPESEPLAPDYLSSLPPEEFSSITLQPRVASRLIAFDYPVNEYLIAFRDEEKPKAPAVGKQYIYLYRHDDSAMREVLEEPAYLLLELLFSGQNVGKALETLTTDRPELADQVMAGLSGWFQDWFEKGFFAA